MLFLDIRMPQIDGIEVTKKIRERNPDVTIIFLTSILDRVIDGYRVKAANYLKKPVEAGERYGDEGNHYLGKEEKSIINYSCYQS